MPRFKHYLEYGALRALAGLFRRLPYSAALACVWPLAWFAHRILRFRVREARRRIREVFGNRFSAAEIRRIAWISWRNICFNAVEILRLSLIDDAFIAAWCDTGEVEKVKALIRNDQGAILAVPHMGNWDLAGIAAHRMGIPFFFIARRQKNQLVDDYLNRMRGSTGVETILSDDQAMLRQVVRRLKAGMVFAILPDVRSRTESLVVPFLGGSANLAHGMALFARLGQAPVIPAVILRDGWRRHRWQAFPPIYPDPSLDKESDYKRITEHVMNHFSSVIAEHPENYFWYNKRWVLDPL